LSRRPFFFSDSVIVVVIVGAIFGVTAPASVWRMFSFFSSVRCIEDGIDLMMSHPPSSHPDNGVEHSSPEE
jgi:hypothetical protein